MDKDFSTGTQENDQIYVEALVNNVLLEGLFFYTSFVMFYALAQNNKMLNSARMIGLINRDEATHCALVINILNHVVAENPNLWSLDFQQKMVEKIKHAVNLEIEWGKSIIGNGILGVNPENLTKYVQFLGDLRLESIHLPKVWNVENPFPWVDNYTQINQELGAFFETSVARYSQEQPEFEQESLEW
jgi:ribonucleoside-diphosphate reductase beta chain